MRLTRPNLEFHKSLDARMLDSITRLIKLGFDRSTQVIAIWVVLALASLATTYFGITFDSSPASLTKPPPAALQVSKLDREFPNLQNLVTLKIVGKTPQAVATAREDVLRELSTRTDIFNLALSPGHGPYYGTNAFLLQDTADLAGRLAYVENLRPLLDAVSKSPTLDSLTKLADSVAAAADSGSNPQAFVDLFNELSATIQASMNGVQRPVNWLSVTGMQIQKNPKIILVLAWPRQGQNAAAIKLLDQLQTRPCADCLLTVEAKPSLDPPTPEAPAPSQFFAASLMTSIFVTLVTLVLSGSVHFALIVTLAWLPVQAMSWPLLVLVSPITTLIIPGLVAASLFAMLMLAQTTNAFAISTVGRRGHTVKKATMNAQEALRRCLVFIVFTAAFLGQTIAPSTAVTGMLVFCVCLFITAAIASMTLVPALLRALAPPDFSSQMMRANLRHVRAPILIAALFCATIAQSTLLPKLWHPVPATFAQSPEISVLATTYDEAAAIAEGLKTMPEVKSARWLGGFLPQDIDNKMNLLATIPQNDAVLEVLTTQDPRAELQKLEAAIAKVTEMSGVNAPMLQAALESRRSLTLFLQSADAQSMAALEKLSFSGLIDFKRELASLANLRQPSELDLDQSLQGLYRSPSGIYRIEIEPAEDISVRSLANLLTLRGILPASQDVASQQVKNGLRNAMFILIGTGLLACFMMLVLIRRDGMAAFRSALAIVAAMVSAAFFLFLGGTGPDSRAIIWTIVVIAVIWGQASFSPTAEIYRSRSGPRLAPFDYLLWFPAFATLGLALALWLVGNAENAIWAASAAAVMLQVACLSALVTPRGTGPDRG